VRDDRNSRKLQGDGIGLGSGLPLYGRGFRGERRDREEQSSSDNGFWEDAHGKSSHHCRRRTWAMTVLLRPAEFTPMGHRVTVACPDAYHPRFGSWRHPSFSPIAVFVLLYAHFTTADTLTIGVRTVSAVAAQFR